MHPVPGKVAWSIVPPAMTPVSGYELNGSKSLSGSGKEKWR